jgi:hypothetical protein
MQRRPVGLKPASSGTRAITVERMPASRRTDGLLRRHIHETGQGYPNLKGLAIRLCGRTVCRPSASRLPSDKGRLGWVNVLYTSDPIHRILTWALREGYKCRPVVVVGHSTICCCSGSLLCLAGSVFWALCKCGAAGLSTGGSETISATRQLGVHENH